MHNIKIPNMFNDWLINKDMGIAGWGSRYAGFSWVSMREMEARA